MKKIGLLGGSFDPPHKGHLYISLEAKKILNLSEIWWLISPKNPLKIKDPTSYEERIKNCKILTRNYPIKIKDYERQINSKYSYQTIRHLNTKYKFLKFFWLMGADNLINFNKWQKWRKIFDEVPIVVFKRHGYNNKALSSIAKKTYNNYSFNEKYIKTNELNSLPAWIFLNNQEIRISSTEIRKQRKILRGKN